MEKFKIKFFPDNKEIEVEKDKTILAAAISCGVYINSACGGDGVCGKCRVKVKKGKVVSQQNAVLSLEEKRENIHLACLTTVHGDLEVEVPAQSRLDFEKSSLYSQSEEIEAQKALDDEKLEYSPLVKKIYLELCAPSLEDNISDLERLYQGIAAVAKGIEFSFLQTGLANIKQLGELLRDANWKITVTLGYRNGATEIIMVEPGDTSARNFGFCFDIGTTTISGQLLDLNTKKVLGTKASYNKQAAFGSDVITRIIYAQEEEGLEELHKAVIETMDQMIRELIEENKIDLNDVTAVLCAGNTTMMHLLVGIDPTYIRRQPYVPTLNFVPTLRASEAGININPRGLLFCLPGVSRYVGGDTTAGVISSGLNHEKVLSLLIDIGTNGEIVLGSEEFLISCAASAGPAFEGSGVVCGMRASSGAIQKVQIEKADFKVNYSTILGAKPRGICGSGYIDIIAEMLRLEIMDKDGKIKPQKHARFREGENGREFVIAFKNETDSGTDIIINEADIDNLKRAKAAIYSAVSVLARKMNFDFAQIGKFFIAGGFGTYLNVDSAVRIGLLPNVERSRLHFIGNSSLAGARQAFLSYNAIKEAQEIAHKMAYLDLSGENDYMDEYMAALFFPHTDLSRFANLRDTGHGACDCGCG
ncbi:MAG: ASKHA domain-containing protein [Candidatus Omnitrophica bacterium]|nr:ASKHA domain-containing protein [Candidatus Omnitrophota bacterium]